ncbi:MAG: type III-A CRISPR-associated protein Csm2 [Bacteroidales bacterium]|nr:type III-A CRISPR-associated protein Csm2 [Bacteroidales bacterium]
MEDLDKIHPEQLIKAAEDKGKALSKNLKTNQVRNFFSAVLSIKNKVELMGNDFKFNEIETELILLKPKLAYAAGRQTSVRPFKEFVDEALEALIKAKDKKKALENFFSLVESFVAYHKYHGGN